MQRHATVFGTLPASSSWCGGVHYLPFFLMGRQLFIHHYLPSHLASALVSGAVLSFIFSETVNYPISVRGPHTRPKPETKADLGLRTVVIVGVFALLMFGMFAYIAPLTYGTPGYAPPYFSSSCIHTDNFVD